jgi:alpha-beta hydrolase superfamily lysophospholipase
MRTVQPVLPTQIASRDGLAYSLWLPDRSRAGIVILHGAGSCKESHYDFARKALALGFAALSFDQRGHGDSEGPMDDRAVQDVASMAALLREATGDPELPIALRGSSMGGLLAILAAEESGADAVVAICPATAEGLRRGLHAGAFSFEADVPAVDALLASADLHATVAQLRAPVLLLHAEGDERVPVEHSRELATHLGHPESRLIAVPGGHHRSVQHDDELQAVSLRWLGKVLRPAA